MSLKKVRWGLAIAGLLAAEVPLIIAAFAWVAIYSYLVNPGHTAAFYENYAQQTTPYLALLLGIPAFFLACRWFGLRVPAAAQATALAFAFGVTLLSGLFFTLLPIARSVRKDAGSSLVSRSGGSDRSNQRLSSGLVVVQISIAVMLLIESGLMLRSFEKLQSVEPGFRGTGVLSFQVSMSRAQFRSTLQSAALFSELTDRIRSVPGVENAGATLQLPIAGLDVDLTQPVFLSSP